MQSKQIVIRSSPFLFLKRLVFIEFFFAVLPFLMAWLIDLLLADLTETYQILPFAGAISFRLFAALAATTVQLFIVAVAFFTWYLPVVVVNCNEIVQQRGSFLGERKLANAPFIDQVSVKQGRLAKALNYGALIITSSDSQEQPHLKDISEPYRHAELVREMADSGTLPLMELEPRGAAELVLGGERQNVEYKSSLVWDYHQQCANKSLHEPVMKTVVAFLNSSGGYLLVGVDDDGHVLGLDPDLSTLRKPNIDGFETTLNMSFNKMIGVEFRQFVDVIFPELDEKTICMLRVRPSTHPAFLVNRGEEKFYIRAGNASQSLTISQANRYIQRRFDK